MGPFLNDLSVLHDANLVGVYDSRQAVGDDNRRAVFHQAVEGLLDHPFILCVEGRCRFIEDEDGRILENRARDAYALALSPREAASAVADLGLVAILCRHDEIVGVGDLCGGDDLFQCRVRGSEGYIVEESVVEEYGLLVYVPH